MNKVLAIKIMKMNKKMTKIMNNQENTADEIQNINLESISQLTKSIEQLSLNTNVNTQIPLTHDSDKLPKPSQYVEFQLQNENEWNRSQIISRASKATSKYKHLFLVP